MQVDLRDLTKGPIKKQILLFSLPLILSNLLQVLFNLADVAVVGRFAGASALGSVGSTSTLIVLFTGFLIGMGSGVNVIVARFYGANDYHALHRTIHTAAVLCTIVGIVIMGVFDV
jgi:Na+-driven multidrug efflux pump